MFDSIIKFFKKLSKDDKKDSKDTAKQRLQLVLTQDRANVSADFLELMKQEIIEVIKKYIDVDENAIDVRLTNKDNGDGTVGAPALFANIPIVSIKEDSKKIHIERKEEKDNKGSKKVTVKEEKIVENKEKEEIKKEDKKDNKKESKKQDKEAENKETEEVKEDSKKEEVKEEKLEAEEKEEIKQEENKETKKEENKDKENTNKSEVK